MKAADHRRFDYSGSQGRCTEETVQRTGWRYMLLRRYGGVFSACKDEWKAEVEMRDRRQQVQGRSFLLSPSSSILDFSSHSKDCFEDDAMSRVPVQASPDSLLCEPCTCVIFAERARERAHSDSGASSLDTTSVDGTTSA